MKLITKTILCIAIFFPALSFADIIFVNHVAQGSNNGTSWQNAFNDLQDALNSFPAPDTIWIADGTYHPTDGTDRNIYFQIPNGTAIFGGFEGTETQLSQRDWEANETILSGDIGEQGNISDNSFTILYATQTDTTTTIDGLMVMFGNANSDLQVDQAYGPAKSGGGLFLDGLALGNTTSIKINNCNFIDNHAVNIGGGILFYGNGGNVNFTVFNTSFDNNSASSGGAICKFGSCNIIQNFISCTFENNTVEDYGGAYFVFEDGVNIDLVFQDCIFVNNFGSRGAAVARYNLFGANSNNLVISSCSFEGNESDSRGGAISDETLMSSGDIIIDDCTFISNKSAENGSVIYFEAYNPRQLIISRSIFRENQCTNGSGIIYSSNLNVYSINNVFIKNQAFSGACFRDNSSLGIYNLEIYNNTFFNNMANNGSIVRGFNTVDISVVNCIAQNNTSSLFSFFNNVEIRSSLFDVDSCSLLSSQSSTSIICQPNVLFNTDPLFRDTANFDFSLLSCSPAINAGLTSIVDSLGILEDLAGNDRVIDGIVDIGAFEQAAFSAAVDSVQNESCFGVSDGAVYLESSGNPPFDISWQSSNESGTNTTELTPGFYDFAIIDADGCSDTLTVEIETGTALMTSFDVQNESCIGNSNGAIYLSSSGNPPFDISWQSGNESGTNTTGLAPGVYDFTIIDADGCSDTLTIEIEAATALTTNFESNDATGIDIADGSIDFEVIAGGTPGYTYEWNTGETTSSISDLLPGNYFLTVTDAIFCKYGFAFSVGITTGIEDLEEVNNFKIHPNPVSEFLTIEIENPVSKMHHFQLFDELGRIVLEKELPMLQNNFQVSLEGVPSGFYQFRILNGEVLKKAGKLVVFKK